MNRYFFDLVEDETLSVDPVGTDLASAEAAAEEAVLTLAEYTRDALPGTAGKTLQMTVRDRTGQARFKLDLIFTLERLG